MNAHSPPPPPPPPPPHSHHPQGSGLPPGKYDIFVIPPHSSGSGFLYLPSLNTQRNSFIAGIASTLIVVAIYQAVIPQLKQWLSTVASSGGIGIAICIMGVALLGWALGKTQIEGSTGETRSGDGAQSSSSQSHTRAQSSQQGWWAPPPYSHAGTSEPPPPPPPNSSWQKPAPKPDAAAWEKAREDMRRQKEAAASSTKADAEKTRWEQARAREREAREKEAREKVAAERAKREQEQTNTKDNKADADTSAKRPKAPQSQTSYTESVFSGTSATGSTYSTSSSYSTTPTEHTAPPRQHTGPYSTKDPDKVVIKGVYAFTDGFIKPVAELVRGAGSVTDGLVMRMTTEGLFVDDDVRGVPQREWDVKAWGIKSIETGDYRAVKMHVLRATVRDVENKRYVFVVEDSEAWKVALGLQRLKKGSQVRSMASAGMKEGEVARVLNTVGIL